MNRKEVLDIMEKVELPHVLAIKDEEAETYRVHINGEACEAVWLTAKIVLGIADATEARPKTILKALKQAVKFFGAKRLSWRKMLSDNCP